MTHRECESDYSLNYLYLSRDLSSLLPDYLDIVYFPNLSSYASRAVSGITSSRNAGTSCPLAISSQQNKQIFPSTQFCPISDDCEGAPGYIYPVVPPLPCLVW